MSSRAGTEAGAPAEQPDTRERRSFRRAVVLSLLAGGTLRILVALQYRYVPAGGVSAPDGAWLKGDGFDYWLLARSLAAGEGYEGIGHGSSMRPPVWPLLLSFALRAVGGDPDPVTLRVFGALVGTCTILLVALLARRVAGRRAGAVAAVIAALYPGFWIFEWSLLSETLLLPVLAAFLWSVYRMIDTPTVGAVVLVGALLGLLCLTRSEQAALGVIVVLPAVMSCRIWSLQRRIGMITVATVVVLAVVSPWLAYNSGRYENRVFLSAGLANTLRAGACEEALSGEMAGLHTSCFAGYAQRYCQRLLDDRDERARFVCGQKDLDPVFGGAVVSEPDRTVIDEYLLPEVVDWYREDPSRMARGAALRAGRVWGAYRPTHTVEHWHVWSYGSRHAIGAWIFGTWVLVPAAAFGVSRLRRRGRAVYPLLAPVVLVTVVTAMTIGDVRYRAAAEVPLVVLAAVAVAAGSQAMRRRSGWTRAHEPEVETTAGPGGRLPTATSSAIPSVGRPGGGPGHRRETR